MTAWSLDAWQFHSLSADIRRRGLDWCERAAPGCHVLTAYFIDEGRTDLDVLIENDDFVFATVTTSIPPPSELLQAAIAYAQQPTHEVVR